MLQMDASEGITPSEVLAHPFITMSHLVNDSDYSFDTSTAPCHRVIVVQPMSCMDSMQEDESTEQQSDNHQISSQAVLNNFVYDTGLKLESLSETNMAAAVSLSKSDMAAAITETTPSLNATEAGAPAIAAVDSAAVDIASVPMSSAAAAAALNQMDQHLDNTESTNTTSEVSKTVQSCSSIFVRP
ncbi:uncharacterized protein LOC144542782 [Centroberyx gerrardi]